MPHLAFTLLQTVVISSGLALLGNRGVRERVYYGTYVFLCCTTIVVAGSWVMYLITPP